MRQPVTKDSIYLIVADETSEFNNAMRYACQAAQKSGAHVGVVYVMPEPGFLHWGNLEERMQKDRRQEAETHLQKIAQKVRDISGLTASVYVGEGKRTEAVVKVIRDNPNITKLILGGSTRAGGPGPLVNYFMGKGIAKLPVPLTVVPDHIAVEDFVEEG